MFLYVYSIYRLYITDIYIEYYNIDNKFSRPIWKEKYMGQREKPINSTVIEGDKWQRWRGASKRKKIRPNKFITETDLFFNFVFIGDFTDSQQGGYTLVSNEPSFVFVRNRRIWLNQTRYDFVGFVEFCHCIGSALDFRFIWVDSKTMHNFR